MIEKHLNDWSEFPAEMNRIRDRYGTIRTELSDGRVLTTPNAILFRGQANADWQLQTTLERRTEKELSVGEYIQKANAVVNELESSTGKHWDLKNYLQLLAEIREHGERPYLPCYEYLVYLRHHGFPSPLLDWTTSPFIAAYFACCDPVSADKMAVFAYVPIITGSRGGWITDPRITPLGHYITTHSRHFAQKLGIQSRPGGQIRKESIGSAPTKKHF